ncbi:two-component system sensor kinase [Candidatus Vecturithrix granuli]|uniref:Two-component system sensor kinase n=1 Tax=Vecturithrix granuli TaxID=1499967 RepID=A0A081C6B2_VECG1|nr:two-component system sensor kinase [Candidatus Vecturithrix granuli]
MQPTALAGIIDQAIELAATDYDLKKTYDFRNIAITCDYVPEMLDIPVVAVEIEQVLLNLLKNAAQAMSSNPPDCLPRITLRLRRDNRCGD